MRGLTILDVPKDAVPSIPSLGRVFRGARKGTPLQLPPAPGEVVFLQAGFK